MIDEHRWTAWLNRACREGGYFLRSYSFTTDNKLRIKVWDEHISAFTQKSADLVMGHKYSDVFPAIRVGTDDALSIAIKSRNKLIVKDHYFQCIHGHVKADVSISHIKSPGAKPADVNVTILPLSLCPMAMKIEESQRFIDIGKTASGLAHGVRSPLNAIKGAVVYLREKYAKEKTLLEFTRVMEEEISRLDIFISKFLSGSLSDTEYTTVDINALLKKVIVLTSLQACAGNVAVSCEYGDIPKIRISSFQLEQAILNIINNSIEAMPSGGRLAIRTQMDKRLHEAFIMVEISDSGPGMTRIKTENMRSADRNEGRGFGLSITREALQFYGGHMEIKSKKGKGTDIRLYLPVGPNQAVKTI